MLVTAKSIHPAAREEPVHRTGLKAAHLLSIAVAHTVPYPRSKTNAAVAS